MDVDAALAAEDRLESLPDGRYAVAAATFDATVAPREDGGGVAVTVTVPTLDAAVAEESVAEVVEDGWYDTLVRRLEDLGDGGVTTAEVEGPTVERHDDEVVVSATVRDGGTVAADAVAVANYVEGTWFQGVVPGYTYVDRVRREREAAADRG